MGGAHECPYPARAECVDRHCPWHLILLGGFSIVIILIEKRGLWGLVRRVLSDDLIPIAHKPSAAFVTATKAASGPAAIAETQEPAS